MVKNLPLMQETRVPSLGWEDPLEEGMATLSSTLAYHPACPQQADGAKGAGAHPSDVTLD